MHIPHLLIDICYHVFMNKKGFTLIELIIVISIIGILAVALISFLNPVEQVDRGSDTAKRGFAADFVGALSSYMSQKQYSVNCTDAACGTYRYNGTNQLSTLSNIDLELAASQVSKASGVFYQNAKASSIYVTFIADGINSAARVCWQPKSKAMYSNAVENKYDSTGTVSGCEGTSSCYSCIFQ